MKTIDRIVWGSVAAIAIAIAAVSLIARQDRMRHALLVKLAAGSSIRAAVEPWRRRPGWEGMKIHGNAPAIVRDVFAADPPTPEGRQALFAKHLDPSAYYFCGAWQGTIDSVTPTSDGWETVVTIGTHLKSAGGVPFNNSKTIETWNISKTGDARCVKCDQVPGFFFVD